MKKVHIHIHNRTKDADLILEKMVESLVKNVKAVMQVRKISLREAVAIVKKESIAGPKSWELALQQLKTKDGLEEAINLTSVLNKFPSLRAYGLSSIKYKSGEVYTVSTYDLPKEDLASLIAYVKSIKTVKDKKAPCGCK